MLLNTVLSAARVRLCSSTNSMVNCVWMVIAIAITGQGVSRGGEGSLSTAPQQKLTAEFTERADELLKSFEMHAEPVLNQFCLDCHNQDYNEANVKLDILDPDMLRGQDAEKWHAALDMINSGEMPPDEVEQPSGDQRRLLVNWITESLDAARELRRGDEQSTLRRLTKQQYANTLRDLLHLPIDFGANLPDDSPSRLGFRNSSASQQTSALHYQNYEAAAREALSKAIVVGGRPKPFRIRATLGRNVGADHHAASIGGYQSMPIDPDHVRVEILDKAGQPRIADSDQEKEELLNVERNIGVGMRGSAGDRFRVAKDGIVLDSALPHKEVTPKSWQGPSPNLKLLLRRCAPKAGPFRLFVKASRAEFSDQLPTGLVTLRDTAPLVQVEDLQRQSSGSRRITLTAEEFEGYRNMVFNEEVLAAEDVTKNCHAHAQLTIEKGGLYQVDLVHPLAPVAAMPSITLRINDSSEHVRLDDIEPDGSASLMVTPIAHANLEPGDHYLLVGGKFFVGLSHVVLTRLPEDHHVLTELTNSRRRNSARFMDATPSLRVFIGTRTDDGMEYETFGSSTPVESKQGAAEVFEFRDYLENLPSPTYDALEQGDLSNIMIIGMWNDYLVKKRQDQGPPLLIQHIEFESPFHPIWPPASHTAIFFDDPLRDSDLDGYTRRVIKQFMARAFRRSVDEQEVSRYYQFWQEVRDDFESYEEGVREALVAVLCSPSFLYLDRPVAADQQSHQLATNLSYFLWNSPPDEWLHELANEGNLQSNLDKTVERMLQDPKASRFTQTFTEEWLRLDRHQSMKVDANAFQDYSRFVKQDMRQETLQFFHHVVVENLSTRVLVDSDFAILNQNLAEFYGISGVRGAEFRPVALDSAAGRGGLLSQGAFLVGHSNGTDSHPIKRAVWVKERILGDPPPPPPPNVPELDPDTPGFDKLTLKEQLELHRNKESCVDCHRKIDPYGVVFEEYDAVGRLRSEAKGKPIDDMSELPDGTQVKGVAELKKYILQEQYDSFLESLCEHLFAYATGRDITYIEQPEIDRLVVAARQDDRLGSIILSVVQSEAFLRKPSHEEIQGDAK